MIGAIHGGSRDGEDGHGLGVLSFFFSLMSSWSRKLGLVCLGMAAGNGKGRGGMTALFLIFRVLIRPWLRRAGRRGRAKCPCKCDTKLRHPACGRTDGGIPLGRVKVSEEAHVLGWRRRRGRGFHIAGVPCAGVVRADRQRAKERPVRVLSMVGRTCNVFTLLGSKEYDGFHLRYQVTLTLPLVARNLD